MQIVLSNNFWEFKKRLRKKFLQLKIENKQSLSTTSSDSKLAFIGFKKLLEPRPHLDRNGRKIKKTNSLSLFSTELKQEENKKKLSKQYKSNHLINKKFKLSFI